MTRASGEFAPLSNSRKWAVILILVGKPQQAPTGERVGIGVGRLDVDVQSISKFQT